MNKRLLTRFLAVLIFMSSVLSGEEVGAQTLLYASSFWPNKVTVNVDVVGKKHGNQVPAGREWMFLRCQDGKCLVDMGHNGIFALDPEDTDLIPRIQSNMQERPEDYQGLFTHRYTKTFYNPDTLKAYQLGGELEEFERFILFYFDYDQENKQSAAIGDFVSQYQNAMKERHGMCVLLLPESNVIADDVVDEFIKDGFKAPTVVPFMREGALYTLQHKPKEKGDVVIVDKNGLILGQFFLSDFGDNYEHKMMLNIIDEILK